MGLAESLVRQWHLQLCAGKRLLCGESDWIADALPCESGLSNKETARTRPG